MSPTIITMRFYTLLFIFFFYLNLSPLPLFAQEKLETEAFELLEKKAYQRAIESFEAAMPLTIPGLRSLADCYEKTGLLEKAISAYATLYSIEQHTSEDLFKISSLLRQSNDLLTSLDWMEKFKEQEPNDPRAIDYLNNRASIPLLLQDQGQFSVKKLSLNSSKSDFSPAFYKDYLVFLSNRYSYSPDTANYNWNQLSDLAMLSIPIKQLNKLAITLSNRPYKTSNDGSVAFNKKGNLMVYTKNLASKKHPEKKALLQLFFSHKNELGIWEKPKPFQYNSTKYAVAQPWLSKDGNTLYFASDMPGGYGGYDIYRTQRDEGGKWMTPQNLGATVNTKSDEMHPFFQEETNVLLFSSKGWFGLGGLDLFLTQKTSDSTFTPVFNLGFPVNSSQDDFGLILNDDLKTGFFSSNRLPDKKHPNIYKMNILIPIIEPAEKD